MADYISSRKEIRDAALDITRQTQAQLGDLVDIFINMSIDEIQDPAWSFLPRKQVHHLWSFNRRKTTFATVATTSDYVLPRDVDKIAILRQTTTPARLQQWTDDRFFELEPDPTDTGNPRIYRQWEVSGVSAKLATADTIDIVSSSTSDDDDTELVITVWGYVGGILRSETLTLDGTTTVNGAVTFDANDVFISKQKATTGTITVTENSGSTTILTLAPRDRSPLSKVISLYPIPSSAITMSLNYFTTIPHLTNDSDAPIFSEKWHYMVVLGTVAKIYERLGKSEDQMRMQQLFRNKVRTMVQSDRTTPDLIERLKRHDPVRDRSTIHLIRTTDAIA